jgi:hypothetical protein
VWLCLYHILQVVTYTLARDVGAESERTCEDFKQFLRDIADAGIVKVIIAYASLHSALVLTHQLVRHISCSANATSITVAASHAVPMLHTTLLKYCCGELCTTYDNAHV